MSEHETDPQRRPADTGVEPSHPTADLPAVDRGPSNAAPDAADATSEVPQQSTPPVPSAPPAATAADPFAPPAPTTPQPSAPQAATAPEPSAPPAAAAPEPSEPATAPASPGPAAGPAPAPSYPGHGYAGPAGYPQPGYPTNPWQPGWSGHAGHPGYPHQPAPGGAAGQPPHFGAAPVPPWAQRPAPRPGRIAKLAVAGVAGLALMLGSGVAGGVVALVADGGNHAPTYTAAPIINSADLPSIAAKVQNSVVSITTGSGEGSGVVLTADGYVLTNNHVVASAEGDTVRVVFADGKNVSAKIMGTDPKTDLAVVKAQGVSGLTPATFGDSDAMRVGDTVLALGSPLGLQGSVTAGIISARDRTIRASSEGQQLLPQQGGVSSISGLLQTDAPINPGNSGGALVNTRGEVIGINTAIATAGQSNGNIGVGFAIPSNKAKDVAKQLQRGEKISHPSLGVTVGDGENGGAVIGSVLPGSAAEKAGLRQGDVITRFGDRTIKDSNDLVAAVQAGKVGDQVQVTYTRNGAEATTTVTLAES